MVGTSGNEAMRVLPRAQLAFLDQRQQRIDGADEHVHARSSQDQGRFEANSRCRQM
jgi:hypothetical protein